MINSMPSKISIELSPLDMSFNKDDGNLIVKGDTFEVQTTTIQMEDHNIELGKIAMPSDETAQGGGIILKGSNDKLLTWEKGINGGNWTSNVNFNLEKGKYYKIDNQNVLTSVSLGDKIVSSKLEEVGTIKTGVWQGTPIDMKYTQLKAGKNIELSGNTLNVPDTLIADEAIQNKHFSDNLLEIKKINLVINHKFAKLIAKILPKVLNIPLTDSVIRALTCRSIIDSSKAVRELGYKPKKPIYKYIYELIKLS